MSTLMIEPTGTFLVVNDTRKTSPSFRLVISASSIFGNGSAGGPPAPGPDAEHSRTTNPVRKSNAIVLFNVDLMTSFALRAVGV